MQAAHFSALKGNAWMHPPPVVCLDQAFTFYLILKAHFIYLLFIWRYDTVRVAVKKQLAGVGCPSTVYMSPAWWQALL